MDYMEDDEDVFFERNLNQRIYYIKIKACFTIFTLALSVLMGIFSKYIPKKEIFFSIFGIIVFSSISSIFWILFILSRRIKKIKAYFSKQENLLRNVSEKCEKYTEKCNEIYTSKISFIHNQYLEVNNELRDRIRNIERFLIFKKINKHKQSKKNNLNGINNEKPISANKELNVYFINYQDEKIIKKITSTNKQIITINKKIKKYHDCLPIDSPLFRYQEENQKNNAQNSLQHINKSKRQYLISYRKCEDSNIFLIKENESKLENLDLKLIDKNSYGDIMDSSDKDIMDSSDKDIMDSSDKDIMDSSDKDIMDSSDKDIMDSSDKDIMDSSDKDIMDSSDKDIMDLSHEDIMDLPNKDIMDSSDKDIMDSSDKDIMDSSDKDIMDSSDKDIMDLSHEDIMDLSDKDIMDLPDFNSNLSENTEFFIKEYYKYSYDNKEYKEYKNTLLKKNKLDKKDVSKRKEKITSKFGLIGSNMFEYQNLILNNETYPKYNNNKWNDIWNERRNNSKLKFELEETPTDKKYNKRYNKKDYKKDLYDPIMGNSLNELYNLNKLKIKREINDEAIFNRTFNISSEYLTDFDENLSVQLLK